MFGSSKPFTNIATSSLVTYNWVQIKQNIYWNWLISGFCHESMCITRGFISYGDTNEWNGKMSAVIGVGIGWP